MKGPGLRTWARDADLPARGGDEAIAPLGTEAVLGLVRERMVRPDAPAPTGARWTYARWKPGISVCAAFELEFDDGSRETVVTKRHTGDKSRTMSQRGTPRPHPRAAKKDGGWSSHLGPPLSVPEELLYVWAAHDDRELPALRVVADMRRRGGLIRTLGAFPGLGVRKRRSGAVLLRYRPERRAVLRLDLALRSDDDGTQKTKETVAARALSVSATQRVQAARRACGDLPFGARLLGETGDTGLLLEEWLDVEVPESDRFDHVDRAGVVLAALHARPTPTGTDPAPAEGADLSQLAPLFAWSPELVELSRDLRGGLVGTPGAVAWTHGDFHPDQVATDRPSGETALMDLDELALRDPAADLASWIADHMLAETCSLEQGSRSLLAAYVGAGGVAPHDDRLRSHVGLHLVHRAAGACRRLEQGAEATAAQLLRAARDVAPPGSVFA